MKYITAKEAHEKTDKVLGLMYKDDKEKIFNAIHGAIALGEYLVLIETNDFRWFDTEYNDKFRKTMEEIGYEISVNGDGSKIIIEW